MLSGVLVFDVIVHSCVALQVGRDVCIRCEVPLRYLDRGWVVLDSLGGWFGQMGFRGTLVRSLAIGTCLS
jgi:hypothetical protein